MARARSAELINDFLGSAQVFASAITQVVEQKLLRQVAGEGLTLSQFKLLKLVAETDAHSIGAVASFLGVSNAAASKAVDKLVRRDLLLRTEGEADRRAIQLSLTATSRRLLAAYTAAKNRKLARIFRAFAPQALFRTTQVLDRLSAGIVDHRADPKELCLQCGIYFRKNCPLRRLVGRQCFYELRRGREPASPRRPMMAAANA